MLGVKGVVVAVVERMVLSFGGRWPGVGRWWLVFHHRREVVVVDVGRSWRVRIRGWRVRRCLFGGLRAVRFILLSHRCDRQTARSPRKGIHRTICPFCSKICRRKSQRKVVREGTIHSRGLGSQLRSFLRVCSGSQVSPF
jgi:hypothetical protein